jgi:EpsI family protein
MLVAAALGTALRPTIFLASERKAIDLKTMIPTTFGNWHEEPSLAAQVIDPQQQETVERIYSETLTRTYAYSSGYRIMLSVAYGKDQSKSLELHSPEVCYPAQGFSVAGKRNATIRLFGKPITAKRLETKLGQRHEPVTYWNVIGARITTGLLQKRLVDLSYTIVGKIPDGLLFRISSIDKEVDNAYAMHDQFASELIQAIAPENRDRFIGEIGTR